MKKLLIVILLAITTTISSQVYFSCYHRTTAIWNEYNKEFEKTGDYAEPSMFMMNKAETMFTHTIEEKTSTYYVISRRYDETNDVYTYECVSDSGGEYYCVFDPKNFEVRIMYKYKSTTYMVVFAVKTMF